MLIAITRDRGCGYWLRLRSDMPRIFCETRDIAITILEANVRSIERVGSLASTGSFI